MGKYCCLLCPKEFSSESGVKYHILKTHAEVGQGWGLVREPHGGGWAGAGEAGRGVLVGLTARMAFL